MGKLRGKFKTEKGGRIRAILFSAILKAVMAVCAIIIVYAVVAENNKSILGCRLFIVQTGSMQGTLEIGDLIVTKRPDKERLRVGDIVTFLSPDPEIRGKANTHRLIAIEGGLYYTQGDAPGAQPDETPVKFEDILGVLAWKSTILGRVITWFENPVIMVVFVILPTVLLFYFETQSGKRLLQRILRRRRQTKSAEEIEKEILQSILLPQPEPEPEPEPQAAPDSPAEDCFSASSREMYLEKLAGEMSGFSR